MQSKKTGYTDNWIFLPAAGYRDYDFLNDVGSRGYYWSSKIGTLPEYAYRMFFSSDYVSSFDDRNRYRYYGQSVRPVSE